MLNVVKMACLGSTVDPFENVTPFSLSPAKIRKKPLSSVYHSSSLDKLFQRTLRNYLE